MRRVPTLIAILAPLVFSATFAATASAQADGAATAWRPEAPAELFDVVRVVDGDTIHVLRAGKTEKLRLLSVDTEEKITGRASLSPTKPETLFGQECAEWAKTFFDELAADDAPARVGLLFPGGKEARDVYGRLLCHVLLPDGTDFNLLLVREGKSPYFNKYGNSRLCHAAFVAAQGEARAERRGIWNPATNRPKDPEAPAARRPYERLLPWWQARAEAIEGFRRASAEAPGTVLAADDPAALEAARRAGAAAADHTVRVFGEIDRFFDEDDGTVTVLFRTGSRDDAFRATLQGPAKDELRARLEASQEEFRQNFLFVEGRIVRGPRGFRMDAADPERWSAAGPEPMLPEGR